ncbi:FAD binding domain-containing protein [uncultured Sphaerochaeta sp.]|uniref:FAD binding domain-containing protein n=1 Tax=uncultured Sphaerochaeta sp. TaxID=886478 RepID=UPI002A0A8720|nr:FAD binding domain-containing protein [uncultured Sphaerochaeta sp.]
MEQTHYYRPTTLEETLHLLATEQASLLAGGVLLVPFIHSQRLNRPAIIDISAIQELRIQVEKDGKLHIGPLCTMTLLANSQNPVLAKACSLVGNLQIRNQATLGGNILSGARYSDVVPALLLLDSSLVFQSLWGSRTVGLASYLAHKDQRIKKAELLVDIIVTPFPPKSPFFITKVARKQAGTKALVTICQIARQEGNRVSDYRLALGSATPLPARLTEVESLLVNPNTRKKGMLELETWLAENLAGKEYKQRAIYTTVERALIDLLGE